MTSTAASTTPPRRPRGVGSVTYVQPVDDTYSVQRTDRAVVVQMGPARLVLTLDAAATLGCRLIETAEGTR